MRSASVPASVQPEAASGHVEQPLVHPAAGDLAESVDRDGALVAARPEAGETHALTAGTRHDRADVYAVPMAPEYVTTSPVSRVTVLLRPTVAGGTGADVPAESPGQRFAGGSTSHRSLKP
ncbi:hypothetical protein ACH4CE_04955 [Streptomyces gelaticus]|uniref:hypothetical protein n=1 Tax=Streptomyces gelaticus TaxID=285446 RepID=UPI0037A4B549